MHLLSKSKYVIQDEDFQNKHTCTQILIHANTQDLISRTPVSVCHVLVENYSSFNNPSVGILF